MPIYKVSYLTNIPGESWKCTAKTDNDPNYKPTVVFKDDDNWCIYIKRKHILTALEDGKKLISLVKPEETEVPEREWDESVDLEASVERISRECL